MFSLTCARMSDWVNNREAGDLWRHRGYYDVSVMANFVGCTARPYVNTPSTCKHLRKYAYSLYYLCKLPHVIQDTFSVSISKSSHQKRVEIRKNRTSWTLRCTCHHSCAEMAPYIHHFGRAARVVWKTAHKLRSRRMLRHLMVCLLPIYDWPPITEHGRWEHEVYNLNSMFLSRFQKSDLSRHEKHGLFQFTNFK